MKSTFALLLTLSIVGCSPSKPQTTIIMQAEVAGYMNGDNDTAGYTKWINEGATIRQVAFQSGCQLKHVLPNCHVQLADFEY